LSQPRSRQRSVERCCLVYSKKDVHPMTQEGEQEATPPWDAARVNLTSKELAPGVSR
jgi:hypothetical protein